MHPLFKKADCISCKIIGAAIEVHKDKGPGLLESIYEKCLMHELALRQIPAKRQIPVEIHYKDLVFKENLKLDIIVDNCLIIELKAVENVHPIHKAQLLSYMKLLNIPLGLLINFNTLKLVDGVSRMILPGANKEYN